MLQTTRRKLKKWSIRLFWVAVAAVVVWVNYNRFYHNNFANYEKAVDYGRVREDKEIIRPVIAAVFYQTEQIKSKTLSGYLSHWKADNLQNPKILIVPESVTDANLQVITKLYNKIKQFAAVKSITFVGGDSLQEHKSLLRRNFGAEVHSPEFSAQDIFSAKEIDEFLQQDGAMAVFGADFNGDDKDNFLIDEAVYLAQKNAYKIRVFDEVDTQLARALEDNYASWFESGNTVNELQRQKNNLQEYINHYGRDILQYFTMNLGAAGDNAIWPDKTPETYRLFDRGTVYIRFFGNGNKEVFSRAKIGKNKGIIVAIVELARKAVAKKIQPVAYKIYLLTELEKIEKDVNLPLINYLETDDGLYVQYRRRSALMAADERPNEEEALMTAIRGRVKVPDTVADEQMEFYRFKTVEMKNED